MTKSLACEELWLVCTRLRRAPQAGRRFFDPLSTPCRPAAAALPGWALPTSDKGQATATSCTIASKSIRKQNRQAEQTAEDDASDGHMRRQIHTQAQKDKHMPKTLSPYVR